MPHSSSYPLLSWRFDGHGNECCLGPDLTLLRAAQIEYCLILLVKLAARYPIDQLKPQSHRQIELHRRADRPGNLSIQHTDHHYPDAQHNQSCCGRILDVLCPYLAGCHVAPVLCFEKFAGLDQMSSLLNLPCLELNVRLLRLEVAIAYMVDSNSGVVGPCTTGTRKSRQSIVLATRFRP